MCHPQAPQKLTLTCSPAAGPSRRILLNRVRGTSLLYVDQGRCTGAFPSLDSRPKGLCMSQDMANWASVFYILSKIWLSGLNSPFLPISPYHIPGWIFQAESSLLHNQVPDEPNNEFSVGPICAVLRVHWRRRKTWLASSLLTPAIYRHSFTTLRTF